MEPASRGLHGHFDLRLPFVMNELFQAIER